MNALIVALVLMFLMILRLGWDVVKLQRRVTTLEGRK